MALTPLLGCAASRPINHAAGLDVATTYPPMATEGHLHGERDQAPEAVAECPTDCGCRGAIDDCGITTAIATKMKASGNERSAQAVKAIAMRTSVSSSFATAAGGVSLLVVDINSSLPCEAPAASSLAVTTAFQGLSQESPTWLPSPRQSARPRRRALVRVALHGRPGKRSQPIH
jgi:hypothetical protein